MNGTTSVAPIRGCSPRLMVQVNPPGGDPHGRENPLDQSGSLADQRKDHPVVIGVALDVEDAHTGDRAGRAHDPVDRLFVPSFRKVGDALEAAHGDPSPNESNRR